MAEKLQKTIVLVGLMGAGKSAIGSRLAAQLGVEFSDSDELIEARMDKSVADVFEDNGEPYFRELEYQVIVEDLARAPHVLATGGGAFMEQRVRDLIADQAVSVWLKADLDVLVERVSRKETRPLLRGGDTRGIMERLMEVRYPIYQQADVTVQTDAGSHENVVEAVIESCLK